MNGAEGAVLVKPILRFRGPNKRGQDPFVRSTRRAVPAKEPCPLLLGPLMEIDLLLLAAAVGFGLLALLWLWWFWLGAHLFFLIGFRNRLLVLIEWAWSYFSYQRGARIILGGDAARGEERD